MNREDKYIKILKKTSNKSLMNIKGDIWIQTHNARTTQRGYTINHKTVLRLMNQLGLKIIGKNS